MAFSYVYAVLIGLANWSYLKQIYDRRAWRAHLYMMIGIPFSAGKWTPAGTAQAKCIQSTNITDSKQTNRDDNIMNEKTAIRSILN